MSKKGTLVTELPKGENLPQSEWIFGDKELKKDFRYEVSPVWNPYWTEEKGEIWRAKFTIFRFDEVELEGDVDWQDGVHIYGCEQIEPKIFITLMVITNRAINDCIRLIGEERWSHGGMPWPFKVEDYE